MAEALSDELRCNRALLNRTAQELNERDSTIAALDGDRTALVNDVELRVAGIAQRYAQHVSELHGMVEHLAEKVRCAVAVQQEQQARGGAAAVTQQRALEAQQMLLQQAALAEAQSREEVERVANAASLACAERDTIIQRQQELLEHQARRQFELEAAVVSAAADLDQLRSQSRVQSQSLCTNPSQPRGISLSVSAATRAGSVGTRAYSGSMHQALFPPPPAGGTMALADAATDPHTGGARGPTLPVGGPPPAQQPALNIS